LRTVYDRYLLRHPTERKVIETPQYFFMRVACGLSQNAEEAIRFYRLISSLAYLPSSPTLFNSGTAHSQMSSCYLLDSPDDDLSAIYDRYKDVALLSKFAGGIGLAYHRVRSKGSLIRGTNGLSNGIIPWLKTLDCSVGAVNQGGKRKGAACVYLETWHADIEDFLELRDNTGDEARRAHNLNLANWVPDLCTEIIEVTSQDETAVCNLGSINLGELVDEQTSEGVTVRHFDFDRLGEVVRVAVPFLDRVVDINYYPTEAAARSNAAWRPVGLGLMGLQDVFFKMRLAFDS